MNIKQHLIKIKKYINSNFIKNSLIIILFLSVIFLLKINISNSRKINIQEKKQLQKSSEIKISRNYYGDNFKLKNYDNIKFTLETEGKKIIQNIRNLHKVPTLISEENIDKEVCAGYLWELSEKIWGKTIPYYIGMINKKTNKPAKAWELGNYYKYFGGKDLINFTGSFDLNKKNLYQNHNINSIKNFFLNAFSEESLFGDIGFLYTKTKYTSFLNNWDYNSHITKNMGLSDFDFIIKKDQTSLGSLDLIKETLNCDNSFFLKYNSILENYNLFLNGKRIVLYHKNFYFLTKNNVLGEKVKLKFGDKFSYKDIILGHFFEGKGQADSLFQFICGGDFLPINIIQINPRFLEKM